MEEFLYNKANIGFCTFIYKREIILKNNLLFPITRITAEDLEFTWKYLANCSSGIKITKKLYGYFNNPGSASNRATWERTHSLESVSEIKKYLIHKKICIANEVYEFMYSRFIWSYSKQFAQENRKDLFFRLSNEFNMKKHMSKMILIGEDWRVRMTALIYYINPKLFFTLISKFKGV